MTALDIFRLLVLWLAISSAAPHTGCITTGPQLTTATECWITPAAGGLITISPAGIRYE